MKVNLKEAKLALQGAEKLMALGQKQMAREIASKLHEQAANEIAPGAHHDAHLRAWLDIFCDTSFIMRSQS